MQQAALNSIWTIGHSTRAIEEFVSILKSFKIEVLADVRSFPGSRRFPQFNKSLLEKIMCSSGIQYIHYPDLGGKGVYNDDSLKKSLPFTYNDYMQTSRFNAAISLLETTAKQFRTAFMCAESSWQQCHRAFISDYLKRKNWNVIHIIKEEQFTEHSFTVAGGQIQGKLF